MTTRRALLGALPAAALLGHTSGASARVLPPRVAHDDDDASFARYIAGVKAEGVRMGLSPDVLDAAFAGVRLNRRVIELDRNQPEWHFTWQEYRSRIVSDQRIAGGQAQYAKHAALLRRVEQAYGVPGPFIVGLWGLESDYGRDVGKFNVIEAVATLAWDGRRAAYFHTQLIDCLKILQAGDISPQQMLGSWAGAMGQTQFMPDSFLDYAVDFDHRGRRDLWNDFACVFASTANNLAKAGWHAGVPWGARAALPAGFDQALIRREQHGASKAWVKMPARDWVRMGVTRQDGAAIPPSDTAALVVQPGWPNDEDTYFVYSTQFASLRAYNPSDMYALCICLLADRIA